MNSTATLTGTDLRTYNTIFQHPVSHNLEWRHVDALFRHLGEVVEEHNGNLKVTRNGQVIVLHPHKHKDVSETEEVMALRHFLQRSEALPPPVHDQEAQWLVIIDHHEARIYRSAIHGATPQVIRPHMPGEFLGHAPHSKEFTRGQEKPDPNAFFEPVAAVLNGAGKILIFGSGTGKSSEMEQFVTWLKQHRPALALRLVGTRVVDEHHQSEGELLAQAREFYATGPVTQP